MMINILDDEFARIVIYPQFGIIHHTLHQPVVGDNFKRILQTAADAYIDHNCDKWLSDDRLNNVMSYDEMQWGEKLWLEKIIPAGWNYWAILPSDKVKALINFQIITTGYRNRGVIVEIFHDVDQALNWLKSK